MHPQVATPTKPKNVQFQVVSRVPPRAIFTSSFYVVFTIVLACVVVVADFAARITLCYLFPDPLYIELRQSFALPAVQTGFPLSNGQPKLSVKRIPAVRLFGKCFLSLFGASVPKLLGLDPMGYRFRFLLFPFAFVSRFFISRLMHLSKLLFESVSRWQVAQASFTAFLNRFCCRVNCFAIFPPELYYLT